MVGHDVFRPENFLLVCKDTVGSHASFNTKEINRMLMTQLPAAVTAAECQL